MGPHLILSENSTGGASLIWVSDHTIALITTSDYVTSDPDTGDTGESVRL